MEEIFEYRFTKLDPVGGDHIDPPSVAVYETLLTKGALEQPEPGLAESWSVSPDELTWQLHLREGARYHSGAPCDAPAVVAALNRCRWGDGRARQLWYWDPVNEVVPAGDGVVEVRLHYPYPRLPTLLWGTHTSIHNEQRRQELGSDYGVSAADGTGPYELVSYSRDAVVARRAPPGAKPLKSPLAPEEIRWTAAPTEAERRAALDLGQADIVRAVAKEWVDSKPGWSFAEQPEISQFYLALSFDSSFGFADLDLRRALEALIDRRRLVEVAFGGRGDARRSPVPAGDHRASSFDPTTAPRMSADEAARTLDRLGWTRTPDGRRQKDGVGFVIDCVTQDAEPFRRLAGELTRQMGAWGVRLAFSFVEPFEAFYRACEAHPPAILSKWLWQDAIEAAMGFSQSSCVDDGGGNWQGARLPAVDAAYDEYLRARSPGELEESSEKVQRVFMEELPYIPLCAPTETYALSPRLAGFGPVPGTLYPGYDAVSVQSE